ncbi:MAG TPA: thioredoxin domain-containing protein [Thiolinea sp.]|nr:thioredoxin domain-containing protein [Thiolinea sp.]
MSKSKRERQQNIRERKQLAARRKQQGWRYAIWGVGAVLLLAVLMVLVDSFTTEGSPDQVTARDHGKGSDKASLTLVTYSDFQCPACRVQNQVMQQAWPSIHFKVHMVYRHFPLTNLHPHALLAARYAEAAAQQGKFWEMHDLLFERQAEWSVSDNVPAQFDAYARTLGLDAERLQQALASDAVRDKVQADMASGRKAGARGTPTLYLNGERLTNVRTPQNLIAAVDAARKP